MDYWRLLVKLQIDNWCTLPTAMGEFRMYDTTDDNISVICMGDIKSQGELPLLRIHSSCRSSEVFGALDCDCADQLRETMKNLAIEGRGVIIYQQQEGRGQGLSLKITAVRSMECDNLDTAQAFEKMGLEQDVRTYAEAVDFLKQLNISAVRLVSNNPRKHQYLNDHGIQTQMVNTNPNVRPENKEYLFTKNEKLGHRLPLEATDYVSEPVYFYHSDQPWGELSNFSRHSVFIDGVIWPTTEHYYQAQKFTHEAHREYIRCASTPMLAKSQAYELVDQFGTNDWVTIREDIMRKALRAKFTQHPDLAIKLLSSGNRNLVERTTNDKYWGDPGDGSGQNRLGILLMEVRAGLTSQASLASEQVEYC
nr:GTP cyclohydrolase II RibA [Vibrio rhodolitus]